MDFINFSELSILDLKDALFDYNNKLLIKIENNEDTTLLTRAFEESGVLHSEKFTYANTLKDIIGPKVFVGDFDISNLIHDALISIKGFNELIDPYYNKLKHCLDDLSTIAKSRDDFSEDVFKKYLSRLEKLYCWNGNDLKDFRAEIKQLTGFKRDCEFRLTYKISNIDMQDKINACKSSQEAFKLILDTIEDKTINDFDLVSLKEHFKIELPGPKDKMSYTKFLEDKLNFDRTSSTDFFNGKEAIPNLKQLCLYLALYVEIPVFDNIERFLNINGVSLKGAATFINEYCSVSDNDIKLVLSSGFDKENILLFLKRFAFTRQRYIKK
jgi:hypothetical protein